MRNILDGKALAAEVRKSLAKDIIKYNLHPVLTVIQVGDDPASAVYIRNKRKACEEVGIRFNHVHLPQDVYSYDFEKAIRDAQQKSDGVIVQLPIPKHLSMSRIQKILNPSKDVDGFMPNSPYTPCTPLGIMMMLTSYQIPLEGKHAVVIGRSDIVGKPMAMELLKKDCTVTICHSKTEFLDYYTRDADILVSAVGKPGFVTPDMVRRDAVIIDVGMNRDANGKLCGDVDPAVMENGDGWITPVPGGVGPMTVTALMFNTMEAAKLNRREASRYE